MGFVNMFSLLVYVVLIPLFVVHITYVAITEILKQNRQHMACKRNVLGVSGGFEIGFSIWCRTVVALFHVVIFVYISC